MRSAHFLVHAVWVGLAISAPLTLDRHSLDARHVTPSAAISESVATHALEKRLTMDEFTKSLLIDAGKVLPLNYLLAWAQSVVPFPKPAGSSTPAQQQLPPPGFPSPQNPAGSYNPGSPLLQDPRMQPGNPQSYNPQSYNPQSYNPQSYNPQSYNDPRTNQQAYSQDPRYAAAIQAQPLASAEVQQAPQDSQPRQDFGRTQADLSQMVPQNS